MEGRPRPPLGGLPRTPTDQSCHSLDSSATQGQPVPKTNTSATGPRLSMRSIREVLRLQRAARRPVRPCLEGPSRTDGRVQRCSFAALGIPRLNRTSNPWPGAAAGPGASGAAAGPGARAAGGGPSKMPRICPVAGSRRMVTGSSVSRSRLAEPSGPCSVMLASSSVHVTGRAKENPARSSSASVYSAMAKDSEKSSAPPGSRPVSEYAPPAAGSVGGASMKKAGRRYGPPSPSSPPQSSRARPEAAGGGAAAATRMEPLSVSRRYRSAFVNW